MIMTSMVPAAASSRASNNALAMRRARQAGLDIIYRVIIYTRARATTIESAIGPSDIAHANTGNAEDIWRSCSNPRLRGGAVATSGTSGRTSRSASSMATSHSSPGAGWTNPQPLLLPRFWSSLLQPPACDCPPAGSNYQTATTQYSHTGPRHHHQG